MYVSVSAYNDASHLHECLESIRHHLPDADIEVVDGRYTTHPGPADNSTDETADVAARYSASYRAAGPFPRERDKHQERVELAPNDTFTLFLDADERLTDIQPGELDRQAYQPRIHNPIVYGNRVAYWPRLFIPRDVISINRWDAYLFDSPCTRTDYCTITHRHDQRDTSYREAKYERLDNEDRLESGYYYDEIEDEPRREYFMDELEPDVSESCPECGSYGVVVSPATPYRDGDQLSVAKCCIECNSYRDTEVVGVEEYRFVPDDIEAAYESGDLQDIERLRRELILEGCSFVRSTNPGVVSRMKPAVRLWVDAHIHGNKNEVWS